MRNTDLFKVFCKGFGLYFIIQILINIKDALFFGAVSELYRNVQTDFYYYLWGQFIKAIFNGVAAWVLISKTDVLTKRFLGESSGVSDVNVTKRDLIEVVIIGISGIMMLDAIPDFFHKIIHYIYFNPYDRAERELFWTSKTRAEIVYFAFKFVLGLVVMINFRFISNRLLNTGQDRLSTNSER